RTSRVVASNTRRVSATHGILWIVIIKPVNVRSEHQILVRSEFVVQAPVDQSLAIVACDVEMPIRRQHKRRQRGREERRSVLPRVIRRHEKEGLVLYCWATDRARHLLQRIRYINRIDGPERGRCYTSRDRWRAEVPGRKRVSLPVTRTEQV